MLPPQSGDGNLTHVTPPGSHDGGAHGQGTLIPIGPIFPPPGGLSWPGATPSRPTFLTSGPDPITLFHAFRRRWIMALASGAAVAVVVALICWYFVPADYEVQALFEVNRPETLTIMEQGRPASREEHDLFKKTQQTLVKSQFVLASALRNEGIAQKPSLQAHKNDMIQFLTDEISVDFPGGGDILRIRMKGEDPQELVDIVDAVSTAYQNEVVGKELEDKQKKRDAIETEFRSVTNELNKLHADELQMSKDLKAASSEQIQFQVTFLINELNSLRRQEGDLHREMIAGAARIEEIKGQIAKAQSAEVGTLSMMNVIRTDPRYQQLMLSMQTIDQQIQATSSIIADPNSPRIQSLTKQKAGLEEQIDAIRLELEPVAREAAAGQSMGAMQIDLTNAEQGLKSLGEQLKSIQDEGNKVADELKLMGGTSARFMAITQEIDVLKMSWQDLEAKRRAMTLEIQSGKTRVQKVMPAQRPEGNEWLFKYFLVGLCSSGAMGLTVFGIAYSEFQARRISTASQVADGLGMKVVGALPSLAASGSHASMLQTILNESIDRVRTLLLHASSIDGTKIVMVTSASDGEGKTTVASQLAASLARCGRRTLIVDADIRSPSLHELFDMPSEPGLCEVLRAEMELDDAIRPTRLPGLWLLPAGRCCIEAIQALAKDAIGGVFESLRPEFDFIILDSAPVLTVADSLSIGQHADASIVSVLKDVSQGAKVFDAVERLRGVGINVMGTVVNGEAQRTHRRLLDLTPATAEAEA